MTENHDPFEFPCDFPIKVVGREDIALDLLVATIVRRHVGDLTEGAITCRTSQGGRYRGVTVTVRAESRAQLDGLYAELSRADGVLMVL